MRDAASGGSDVGGREVPIEEASDRDLLQRFRSGQPDAAGRIHRRYVARLRAVVASQCSRDLRRRVAPDDVVQAVFLAFFAGAAAGRFEVREGGDLWSLLLVIALNEVRAAGHFHRARRRDVRRTLDGEAAERALLSVPDRDHAPLVLLRLTLGEVSDRLSPRDREVIELRIGGCEVAEIARRARLSKRSVERILERFRGRVADLIRRE
jgi:RNA polymerase sigma-70 factor, ECF subfamily